MLSRRDFLGESACASLGTASVMSTLLNLRMANKAAAAGLTPGEDCKTLICIYLGGGIDSFNVLVPRDANRYAEYAATRSNLALAQSSLLQLDQDGGDGQLYGLHPSTQPLADMFNGAAGSDFAGKRQLAFVTNVGTLSEPTTPAQVANGTASYPRALFSHSDQTEQWQTSLPNGADDLTGWAGRAADVLHSTLNQDLTSMSISFSGNNIFQVGQSTQQFVMTQRGALRFAGSDADPGTALQLKNAALKSMMEQEYANLMQQGFAELSSSSIAQQEFVQEQFEGFDENSIPVDFPDTGIGRNLEAALRMIALRPTLGLRRQTLFISAGGWDHHGELLNTQAGMLAELAPAIAAFQKALNAMNLADTVVGFTSSDFGRTLRSNGRGTDHAWGGNQMVFGAPISGGKIYGTFPSLALDSANPYDVGRGGRLLPTTSVDEYFGEMLRWFGVTGANLDQVLPNYHLFHDVNAATGSLDMFS